MMKNVILFFAMAICSQVMKKYRERFFLQNGIVNAKAVLKNYDPELFEKCKYGE